MGIIGDKMVWLRLYANSTRTFVVIFPHQKSLEYSQWVFLGMFARLEFELILQERLEEILEYSSSIWKNCVTHLGSCFPLFSGELCGQ